MSIDETRDRLIAAALAHVPFDRWTGRALLAGAADVGPHPALAAHAVPGGPAEQLDALCADPHRPR